MYFRWIPTRNYSWISSQRRNVRLYSQENGGDSQEERGSKEEAWGKWRDILTKPGGLGITHKENGGDS